MKYKIVTAEDPFLLEKKVQKLIDKKGWEPLGAHAVATWRGKDTALRFEYSQVLINQSE